ncbi:hypothetical protein ABT119_05860 [Streptomyces sp. NPDC001910]|uniref:hypothetical protein n=1 Tax=Streptomyces sp. NPDC001910 TaxID=3154403 RepID=UPI00332734C9
MTALRNALTDEELAEQADMGEPEHGRWSQTEQLLAANYDAMRRIEWVLICANTDSKVKRPKAPVPLRRPGSKAIQPKATMSDEQANTIWHLLNGSSEQH